MRKRYRADCGRKTGYECYVEYIGADDIAYGDVVFFFYCRNDACDKFGQGRACGNYRQPYKGFAHSEVFGDFGRVVNHEFAAENNSRKPQSGKQNAFY